MLYGRNRKRREWLPNTQLEVEVDVWILVRLSGWGDDI